MEKDGWVVKSDTFNIHTFIYSTVNKMIDRCPFVISVLSNQRDLRAVY